MPRLKFSKNEKDDIRLSPLIKPECYTIKLIPNLERFTFAGEEEILVSLKTAAAEIKLHAKDISISKVIAITARGKKIVARAMYDGGTETVRLIFQSKISKGKIKLAISFSGKLNDKMRGFYRSHYHIGNKKYIMATTQFEPSDARRAFPCFDEPSMKAVFQVSITAPKGTIAISNTPAAKTEKAPRGGNIYHFAPTPKMSTYLLAFIVGQFEKIETRAKNGVLVQAYTIPGKKEQAEFALDVASRTLTFFDEYFGTPYPLQLLQLIAIPDFSAGAMENWGAITCRESALLIDRKNSSTANKQRVAIVIAHELAHQWFGNLVTMEWWTHLWLNEGFASYIEYLAADKLFPEWDIWTQFVEDDLGRALHLDALKNTHPIEVEVRNPAEIGEIFDVVSYSKGASIIRMLAEYIGEDAFRKGLSSYLKKYKYANATTENLWEALESAAKKPVRKIMKQWTSKPGYPLVEVSGSKGMVMLRQRRFFADSRAFGSDKDETVWAIPLGIEMGGAENIMYAKKKAVKNIPAGTKLNAGETSMMRVLYPDAWMDIFKKRISNGELGPKDRLGLVRDAMVLSSAGAMSTDSFLNILLGYKNENDFMVWKNIASNMNVLRHLLHGTQFVPAYRNFGRSIFADIAKKMGWGKMAHEKHTDSMLRSIVINGFGSYGDKETIRIARTKFKEHQDGVREMDPDIREAVYSLVGQEGGAKEYEILRKKYRKTELQHEKDRLAHAMASFKKPDLLRETLEFALSKSVRSQDAPFIIAEVGANAHGRNIMWEYIKKNWHLLLERYGDGGHLLAVLVYPLGRFTDCSHADKIEKFFKAHTAPGAERAVRQTVERIRANADWLKRDEKKIERFLKPYAERR